MSLRRINVDLSTDRKEHHFILVNTTGVTALAIALVEKDAKMLANELNRWLDSLHTGDTSNG